MKTIISAILLASSLSAFANCPDLEVPKKFMARESIFSSRMTDMSFDAAGKRIAKIEERLLSSTTTFDLYNDKKQKVATARQQLFSWGTTIDVKDCAGKMIGTLKENIYRSLLGDVSSKYTILDGTGSPIATSEKLEILTPNFKVTANNGKQLMKMRLSALSYGSLDEWVVEIPDATQVDPRVLLMIPAFKTSATNREGKK